MPKPRRRRIYPTGLTVWPLAGHDGLAVIWLGSGSGLFLAFDPDKPGNGLTRIEHPSASGTYYTRQAAGIAVNAFMAKVENRNAV
jgi:hypothetical protein